MIRVIIEVDDQGNCKYDMTKKITTNMEINSLVTILEKIKNKMVNDLDTKEMEWYEK